MRKNNIFFIIVPIILSINFVLGTEIAATSRDTNNNEQKTNDQTILQKSVKKHLNQEDTFINEKLDNLDPQQIESQIGEMENEIKTLSVIVYILGFIIFVGLGLFLYKFYIFLNVSNKNVNNQSNHDNKSKFIDMEYFQIKLNEIDKEFKKFDEQLTELKLGYQNRNNQSYTSTYTDVITTQSVKPIKEANYPKKTVKTNLDSPPSISNSDSNLLSAYNLDSRSLSPKAITVSESDYTAEQRRLGRSVPPILEFNPRGSYWILKEANNEYLFPKANLKINEHNYNTIATFFECVGYQSGALNNFTVVKSAKVFSIGEQWELSETGQLNFYQ
ncbi:hypothetical protein [Nostoc commune]|uniref:hypothetical protein n=1 Tax=Nostoc commune TaxID=1178 RepID=UPI0018C5E151|nr:hypothetical protein [Nostoc commune]MBG1264625.1 hypothetical protein [Nostoc commune BAE]